MIINQKTEKHKQMPHNTQKSLRPLRAICGKTPSFTIMEMLVVLILMSIIISSGALLYFQFNKYLQNNIQQTGSENTILLFTRAFKHDLSLPGTISSSADAITIEAKNSNHILYQFDERFIVREAGEAIDTFWMEVKNLELSRNFISGEFQSIQAEFVSGGIVYPFLMVNEPQNVELFNKIQ
jgi:type II secretory pathway pseudopilin PulG